MFQLDWSHYAPQLLHGLVNTLEYTAASFFEAALLGLALALMRRCLVARRALGAREPGADDATGTDHDERWSQATCE